ncbi:hypothetical protein L195_g016745 [Trifolium pratense]|uniref:Uncharacterized protein n=2 Tax=Trifolium pratense TaxID=57577 RepID=A0ACB0JFU7_TRIPR|nr:hypothetical protein L195_g016745 [Trifolium pratense]CAJ2642930.1 unnamed protein product [Trifolium pratense]
MDTVLSPNTKEQSFATTNKQIRIKTSKKNKRGSNNFISSNTSQNFATYAGLLNLPQQQQQPPLLPLPHVSATLHHKPLLSRSLNTQSLSLTPKKTKPKKREETKKKSGTISVSDFLMDNPWGPDPKDLPKNLPVVIGNMDVFSESVFNLAPPPSSLPLPKFFLRSKLSCNTEAAVAAGSFVDHGATNNLRRLLHLR